MKSIGRKANWSLPILTLLGLLLLSLLAAGAAENLWARRERLVQAEHEATALALLVDQHVSRAFEGIDDALERVADKLDGESWDEIERSRPLWMFTVKLVKDLPLLHSLELYDRAGRLRLSNGQFPTPEQGLVRFDEAKFRARLGASPDPLLVAGPVKSQTSERWFMSVGHTIGDERGELRGFVVGSVEPRALRDFFRWAPIGEHGAIELLYEDGTIVVSTERDERLVGRRSTAAALLAGVGQGIGGTVVHGDVLGDGVPRVIAVHPMGRLPFRVIVELTRADVLADWLRRFIWDAAIGIFVTVCFAVVSFLLYRRIAGEHRATMAARLAQQRLHDAVESIGAGFALWDAEDRLVACNSRYRELFGKSGLRIEPGLSFERLVRASCEVGIFRIPQPVEEWIPKRLARHRDRDGVFEQQLSDGRWQLVSERGTSEHGVVGVRTDITALKDKERELERLVHELEESHARTEAQAAELARLAEGYAEAHRQAAEASAGKTLFLASMSHELRTPLNAIIGFSELMMSETFGPLGDAKYKEYAADVHRSGQHLLELINDVVDLSKIEVGKLDLVPERQNLAELMEECRRLVSARAKAKGIKLAVKLPRKLPAVRADRRAAKQILLNLLSNAVKFTEEGGAVSVSGEAKTATVSIAVRDNGIGIAPRDLERLFKPFERAENARRLEGSGLGLAIARSLAEHSGGSLRLESKVGEGTVAWLDLPVDDNTAQAADAA